MMSRSRLLWIIALLMTLVSAAYQRITGPTFPTRGAVAVGSETIKFKLVRSHENPGDAEVSVPAPDMSMSGTYEFRRQPSNDPWIRRPLSRRGDSLVGWIPNQPTSGKVMYRILIGKPGVEPVPLTAEPVVLRFKDYVPRIPILWPHIALMSIGMLCSTRAGLEALVRGSQTYRIALWALAPIFFGGIVLGPIVQKLAFGSYWTGWPVGHDLTDNKTALAIIFWVITVWRLRKKPEARGWVIAAAVITLLVYAIPHSVLGSELDYTQVPQ
jgi:hypothetical protein